MRSERKLACYEILILPHFAFKRKFEDSILINAYCMCTIVGDMYRAAYSTNWVVMGRGNVPPPYTVTYYPEVIPYVGFDSNISNMSPLLSPPPALDVHVSSMQDFSPKKPPWPNKTHCKKFLNGNKNYVSDNSRCANDFKKQRAPMSRANTTIPNATSSKNHGQNETGVMKAATTASSILRRPNMYGKGVKRHLNELSSYSNDSGRSSSPSSDADVELVCVKRKFRDTLTPELNRKSVDSVSNVEASASSPRSLQYLIPKQHFQEPCLSPRNLRRGDEWDALSCEIWNKYISHRQSDEKYNCKMRLHDVLLQLLTPHFPTCSLFVVGSSMNGFGCNSSDIDMCLMLQHPDMDQTVDAINILKHIQKLLNRCDYVQKVELIRAKVPILKFKDSVSGCEVDLNVNNSVGIRNTHLLHQYSKLDWRVRPLVLIIKMWAHVNDINDAKNMTVSSYSLTLMVIHYLQVGVRPYILPCLQKRFPKKYLPDSEVKSLQLEENLHIPASENTLSLGQLFVGFLNYFDNFQFNEQAVSVRLGQRVPKYMCQFQKARKNTPGQWKCLSIEEPFDLTNTARSVYDYEVFARIEGVIKSSHRKLLKNKHLKSILL